GSGPRRAPLGWTLGGTLVLAGLTAWLGLVLRLWKALVGVAVLASGSAVALLLSPSLLGVVLPAVPPLAAAVVAGAGALLWDQFGSAHRLHDLEGERTEIRKALGRHEAAAGAL